MGKKGNQVINLSSDDFKKKSFKTAPAGTYFAKLTAKSALKEMSGGTGINVQCVITKGPHKGVNIFDNIGPNVKWKIAQLCVALGIKKTKFTMAELLKLIKGGELRVIVRVKLYNGAKKNEVVQYLPLTATKDEDTADDLNDVDDDDEDDDEEESDDESDDDDEEDEEDEDEEDEDEDEDDEDDADEDGDEEDEDDDEDDDEDEEDDEEDEDDDVDEDEDEDEDEDDEDDEEEEEEAPAPKKRAPAKKAAAKKTPAKRAPAAKKTARKR